MAVYSLYSVVRTLLTAFATFAAPTQDPTVNGEYATQFVKGMQGDDPTYLKSSACLKHYAAYNEETGRNSFAAMVTSQDMEDTFLPAFQAGVE
jgi:beta-glucosidase